MNDILRHRILLALAALMIVGGAMAQSQRGVVRTAQRPGKQAQKLAGVTIRLRGGNAAVTSTDGAFALGMDGARAGDALYLQSVRKIGYELVDKEIVGRALAYSPNVPIEIVMLNSREKEEDMQRIYDNAYRRAEQTYAERNAALERQLNDKTVSEEAYRQQLQELQQWFDKYQTLINDMAERYASMDYATIDTLNMAINEAIERGDMERADSLISTAGSLEKLVSECMEERQATARRQAAVDQIAKEVEAEKQRNRERTRSTGELLYSKYSTCLARAMNDSAAHYITLRADLDTTNVKWQTDAAHFAYAYLNEFDQAMALYQRALRNAVAQYGESSEQTALVYSGISDVQSFIGQFDDALSNLDKARETLLSVHGENHTAVAETYARIGRAYGRQNNADDAMKYFKKALDIWKATGNDNSIEVSRLYGNIGTVYYMKGNTEKALEYYDMSLDIKKTKLGDNHLEAAKTYNNISAIYLEEKDYAKALDVLSKSMDIVKQRFGENHTDVALAYANISIIYNTTGDHKKALEYSKKAIAIYADRLGNNHPSTIKSYVHTYDTYLKLAQTTTEYNDEFKEFMSELVFTANYSPKDKIAARQGLEGSYILLSLNDWDIESAISLIEYLRNLNKGELTIVVTRDGHTERHRLASLDKGSAFSLRYVGKAEKQRIIEDFRAWKATQND